MNESTLKRHEELKRYLNDVGSRDEQQSLILMANLHHFSELIVSIQRELQLKTASGQISEERRSQAHGEAIALARCYRENFRALKELLGKCWKEQASDDDVLTEWDKVYNELIRRELILPITDNGAKLSVREVHRRVGIVEIIQKTANTAKE